GSVAVHIDARLDLPHQLHQVDDRLAQGVRAAENAARRGGAAALGAVDAGVAVLVDAAAARGKSRGSAGRVDGQRAERSAAVADDVDGDSRDALLRHFRRHHERGALLTVAEAVAEYGDRPAVRRSRPRRHEKIEVNFLRAARRRRARPRTDGGNEFARGLIIRRHEFAEGDLADRAGNEVEERDRNRAGGEDRRGTDLAIEENARYRADREHRPGTAAADIEVNRRRIGRLYPAAHFLERRGGAQRGEDAERHHARAAVRVRTAGRVVQFLAIVRERGTLRPAEVEVMAEPRKRLAFDRIAARVAHAVGDDHRITRVLVEELVRFDVQGIAGGVPHDLIDPDFTSGRTETARVAQVNEKYAVAADAGDVDGTAERDGDSRLRVETVEPVEHLDVLAVRYPHAAIGLRQVDAPRRDLRIVGNGEDVAREDCLAWIASSGHSRRAGPGRGERRA